MMSIRSIHQAIRSKLNRADRISLRFALVLLIGSMLVSAVLLLAAGSAPHERLALYLLEWMGKVELLIAVPFWIAARGVRAAGLAMQSAYRNRSGASASAAPHGHLVHG